MNRSKWLSLALFSSLGVNLFLLGAFSSQLLSEPKSEATPGQVSPNVSRPGDKTARIEQDHSNADLSSKPRHTRGQQKPSKRADAHQVLRRMVNLMGGPDDPRVVALKLDSRKEFKQKRQEIQRAREAVQQALTAEPFEQKKLERAMDELHQRASTAQRLAQEKITSLAAQLTSEERKKFRQLVQKKGRRGSKRVDDEHPTHPRRREAR